MNVVIYINNTEEIFLKNQFPKKLVDSLLEKIRETI